MASFLRKIPLYLLLLPVFFVLHGYRENFGHIPFADGALLVVYYIAAILVVALIVLFFYKDLRKTAFVSAVLFAIYFFFGALHDFLKAYSPIEALTRYRILLPVLLLIFVASIIFCARTKGRLSKLTFFLNLLNKNLD